MDKVDCIVIGAGVVGLAVARDLAQRGIPALILEREAAFGTGTSSRNSEVIHAGIYYEPGSLKARLCVRGRDLLYAYAAEHGVAHRNCGKLIVATSQGQEDRLQTILHAARASGVHDLRLLSASEARATEPELFCTAALLSPSTGIIDSHGLMLSLLGQAEAGGAMLSLRTAVTGVTVTQDGFIVETTDITTGECFPIAARRLVNAAGLHAPEVAGQIAGLDRAHVPEAFFARGNYFSVPGRPAFSRLVYPVPEPGGLGVHLTLDLAGGMRFGPDVDWIDGIDYRVNGDQRSHFEAEVRKYWPSLPAEGLMPTYCGIRPKLVPRGAPAADFRVDGPARHGIPGLVNLFGIESPGLTSSLALAETVSDMLLSG